MRGRTRVLALTVVALGGIMLCSMQLPSQAPPGGAPEQRISIADAELMDASRSRAVPVRFFIPESVHPMPAVVFSPGGGESRDAFDYLGEAWAKAGFLAVFITHPGSDRAAVDELGVQALGLADLDTRPADMTFIVDALLSGRTGIDEIDGRVDVERIAVAGQCAGSTTALALAGLAMPTPASSRESWLHDDVRCVIALSPQILGGAPDSRSSFSPTAWASVRLPSLVITGTQDFGWMASVRQSPELLRLPHDALGSVPKYLISIEGAEHSAFTDSVPYYPSGPRDPRHHEWIAEATTAFLRAQLLEDEAAVAWLRDEVLEDRTGGECQQESAWRPQDAGIAVDMDERFRAAAAYSEQMGGTSVVVATVDEVLFEDYHNGADASTATHIHSATKAFWAAAAAAALEDGLLDAFDERVALTIREWLDLDPPSGKRLITLDHLLTLSSGLSQDVDQIQGHETGADDIYDYVVNSLRLIATPGTWFQYGPSHYYAFGVLLERKLSDAGRSIDPLEYLEERILDPIGLVYEDWVHDEAGNPHIPNGCTITPREWIKYGQFLLSGGNWDGKQIVDADILSEMLLATGPNPGHGRYLWLNRPGGYGSREAWEASEGSMGGFIYHDGYPDLYAAMGAGRNRMYIVPSRGWVIARQTLGDTSFFSDHEFLSVLLSGN